MGRTAWVWLDRGGAIIGTAKRAKSGFRVPTHAVQIAHYDDVHSAWDVCKLVTRRSGGCRGD
jgi:hypothetical protein